MFCPGVDVAMDVAGLVEFSPTTSADGTLSVYGNEVVVSDTTRGALLDGWRAGERWLRDCCDTAAVGLRIEAKLHRCQVTGLAPRALLEDTSYASAAFALVVGSTLGIVAPPDKMVTGVVSPHPAGVGYTLGRLELLPRKVQLLDVVPVAGVRWLLALGDTAPPSVEEQVQRGEGRLILASEVDGFLGFALGGALIMRLCERQLYQRAERIALQCMRMVRCSRYVPAGWANAISQLGAHSEPIRDVSDFAAVLAHGSAGRLAHAIQLVGCIGRAVQNVDTASAQELLAVVPTTLDYAQAGLEAEHIPFVTLLVRGLIRMIADREAPVPGDKLTALMGDAYSFVVAIRSLAAFSFRSSHSAEVSVLASVVSEHTVLGRDRSACELAARIVSAVQGPNVAWRLRQVDVEAHDRDVHVVVDYERGLRGWYEPSCVSFVTTDPHSELARVEHPVLLNEAAGSVAGVPLWLNPAWLDGKRLRPPPDVDARLLPIDLQPRLHQRIQEGFTHGLVFTTSGIQYELGSGTQVRGLSKGVCWRDRIGVWPPSVDSWYILGYLGAALPPETISSVVDIGSGSGILGIAATYWAGRSADSTMLTFVDISSEAVQMGLANAVRVFGENAVDSGAIEVRPLDAAAAGCLGVLSARLNDVCVCAPPYLPHVTELEAMWPAVAGTDLLEWVLTNAARFTRRLIIQYSDICREVVEARVPRDAIRGLGLAAFVIPPYVPFCQWPMSTIPWNVGQEDLRMLLEDEANRNRLTPGLRHFRRHVLPNLLDVTRWPAPQNLIQAL